MDGAPKGAPSSSSAESTRAGTGVSRAGAKKVCVSGTGESEGRRRVRRATGTGGTVWAERHEAPNKARRRGGAHGLNVALAAAVLVLLAAVPAALAVVIAGPTSSSDYGFASSGAQGAGGEWKNADQTVLIAAVPSADTTVTVTFSQSANGGAFASTTWTADAVGPAAHGFVVSAEESNAIEFWASETTPTAVSKTEAPAHAGLVNIDKTAPLFTTTDGLEATSSQSAAAHWSSETTRTISLEATDTVPAGVVATSGMKDFSWRVGSQSLNTATDAVSFQLVKGVGGVVEGSNAVTYFARDWAGNVEATQTGYVNIDTVQPTTTPSPELAPRRRRAGSRRPST